MRREDIAIDTPCGMDFSGMKPAGMKKRFCEACKMHVHDLSRMSRREARALLASPRTEGLCVRYLYDQHGEIVFTDSLVRAKRAVAGVTAAALATMSLTACMGAAPAPVRPPAAPPSAEAPLAVDQTADAGAPAPLAK